ncbi:DUF6990 domain-containing protein [Bartonella machadoae]|uniref:DUF6990 domain-containing protein n=1 Tax=Bartonella machadoae TaxID=2893471 RepID=UPI001F4CD039|nr:hypothetical protein [Bartonella machadoae]UNE53936.1 hypothetical protein LNM86_10180 [Bartonella machadoae]
MESAVALLKSLGWSVEIEGRGDHLATLFLPDREVYFLYNDEHDEMRKDCPNFDRGLLVMTGLFGAACQTINPDNSQILPVVHITFVARGLEIFEERVTKERLQQELDRILKWAKKNTSLQKMLRSRYSAPPWEKNTVIWSTDETVDQLAVKTNEAPYALLHLAALALLGDVETLRSYQKRFAEGNRHGFEAESESATLNESHLERAVVIAEEVAQTEQFSYAVLEQAAEKLFLNAHKYRDFRFRDPNLCNKKRDFQRKCAERKRQELREQGFDGVSDEPIIIEAEGKKYCVDIVYIKDGEPAFMDVSID